MRDYQYTKINIDKINPYDKNARTHSTKQLEQIMNSIKQYGFTNPLLIDENNNLIAGHGRLEAVKQLNRVDFKNNPLMELPAIIIEGLSEADKKALIIADNQIALNAGWDYEILSQELNELADISYDLDLLAFDNIDELLSYDLDDIDENVKELKEVEINQKYELLIKCKNESELERAYNENIERGYECKVLTF